MFLTMGSLARSSWDKLGVLLLPFAIIMPISMLSSWELTALRLGEDHRFYLLVGALVLPLASVASKNIIPAVIIPVGIVTSLVGVPFFLSIIQRHKRKCDAGLQDRCIQLRLPEA